MRIATATHLRLFVPDAGSKADLCRRSGHCWWHPDCFDVAELGATFLVGWVGADDGDSITASTGTPNTTDLGSVAGGTNALASALDHLLDLKKGVAVDYATLPVVGISRTPDGVRSCQSQGLGKPHFLTLMELNLAVARLQAFETSNDFRKSHKGSETLAVIDGNVADLLLSLDGTLEISVER